MKQIKRLICVAVLLMGLILTAYVSILINGAKMINESYWYDNKIYSQSSMPYIKGSLIAITREGHFLYSVEGDRNGDYLVSSYEGHLFRNEDKDIDRTALTGIFFDGKWHYVSDQKVLSIFQEILSEDYKKVLDTGHILDCREEQNPKSAEIYFCYEPAQAAQEFVGCLIEMPEGIVFAPKAAIDHDDYGGKYGTAQGLLFKEEYQEILKNCMN